MSSKSIKIGCINLGVCYYPEQRPKTLWNGDFRRMAEIGLKYIMVAEFAWSLFEPEEGRFTFSFWDEALEGAEIGRPGHRLSGLANVKQAVIIHSYDNDWDSATDS